jgi:hypothetical protein
MQSREHAGILSRSKVRSEAVLAARDRMSPEKTGMPAAINLSALIFANETLALAKWLRSREIAHAECKSNQYESN